MESSYEWRLLRELELRKLTAVNQKSVCVHYKGFFKEELLRADLLIEGCVLVEVKALEHILSLHKAQLLSYMKLLNVPIGLLVNFNAPKLTDGISRLILHGADR